DLDVGTFVAEVTWRRPGPAAALHPSEITLLQKLHADASVVFDKHRREATKLERHLSVAVNEAYGLTPEDVDFLWKTAPPRMPAANPEVPVSELAYRALRCPSAIAPRTPARRPSPGPTTYVSISVRIAGVFKYPFSASRRPRRTSGNSSACVITPPPRMIRW